MPKEDPELLALRDQLADAQAEIERLQAQAADAEARAATAEERLDQAQTEVEALKGRVSDLEGELQAGQADLAEREQRLAELGEEAEGLRQQLRQAALRYREARLAAHPEVPADMVSGETIEEIDQQVEAALKLVSQVKDRLQAGSQAARVPIGSPPRRAPDLSALPAAEKIRLGLSDRR